MWKTVERWRDQLKTGFDNFNFFSRLFQRRHYSQFESQEDSVSSSGNDENKVHGNFPHRTSGSGEVVIHYDSHGDRIKPGIEPTLSQRISRTLRNTRSSFDDSDSDDDDVRWEDAVEYNNNNTEHVRFIKRSQTSSQDFGATRRESVRDEVHEIVGSIVQRQYCRLDEPDISEETDQIIEEDICDNDHEVSHVFHSIKDVDPKWKNKKHNRRKKTAKRTRKAIRTSWKWLKRGMNSYSRAFGLGFNSSNFFVISNTGLYRQKY